MRKLSILYHKGSKGAIYQWSIWTEGAEIVTEHGQVGGQMIISRRLATAKNVGRANETSPEAQAEAEAFAEWKHKQDRKYVDSIDKVHNRKIAVMLAPNEKFIDALKPGKSTNKYAVYPADVQPKLDGARCLAYWEGDRIVLLSRGRKEWDLPHITEQLKKVLPEDAMWDGELYFHGVKRQTIQKWITKHYPETKNIGLHVYDVPISDGEEKPWEERRLELLKVPTAANGMDPHPDTPNIFRVVTLEVQSEEQVLMCQEQLLKGGYEGCMVRNRKGMYEWDVRSKNLLKVKLFEDDEFKVVGFKQAEGDHAGCVIWLCQLHRKTGTVEGPDTFYVVPNGTLDERRELFLEAEKHLGKQLTVLFQGYSIEGKPQIAKGIAFRLEEDQSVPDVISELEPHDGFGKSGDWDDGPPLDPGFNH